QLQPPDFFSLLLKYFILHRLRNRRPYLCKVNQKNIIYMTSNSSPKKLNFAIVGTGSIAGLHLTAINDIPDIQVVALCSSSKDRAQHAQEKYGINTYFELDTLFDQEDIDAIIICTASGHHLQPCIK